MMTTYVLGAGASAHAGYPATSQLWPGLVNWVNSSASASWESQQAIQIIALVELYDSLNSQAADFLPRSDRIVLIGYSMPAADERARSLLLDNANKRAEVCVSCGSANFPLAAEFKAHGFSRVTDNGRFEDYLKKHASAVAP